MSDLSLNERKKHKMIQNPSLCFESILSQFEKNVQDLLLPNITENRMFFLDFTEKKYVFVSEQI